MFLYKDSKLETDIKQLNSNLNKTEYEKAREPLQNQIAILIKIHKDKTVYLEAQEKIMIEYKLAAIMKNIL